MSGAARSLKFPCITGLAAALALSVMISAAGAVLPTVDEVREQIGKGDYVPALEAMEKLLEDPFNESGEWLLLRLDAYMTLGKYPEALKAAEHALAGGERSLQVQWAAREAFLANGETARADAALTEIERLMVDRPWAYRDARSIVIYGKSMSLRGMDPKTVHDKIYAVAGKLEPDSRDPLLAAGELALEKNDSALAAKTFQSALKKFTGDPDFLFGLARAFAPSDRKVMMDNLELALKQNPHHVPSLLRWADHLIDAEKYPEAAQQLDRVAQVNPHQPEMWACRAVLAHLNNDAGAETAARAEALKFWPSNPLPDHVIGRKLSQKYRFAEGAGHQRQALEYAPEYLPAQSQLASDLLRLGDEEEGWKLAETVRKEDGYDVATYNLMTLHDAMAADFATLQDGDFTVRMASREAAVYGERVMQLLQEARTKLGAKYGIEVVRPTIVEIFPTQKDFGVRTFGMPDNPGYLGVCFGRVVTATSPAARPGVAVNWESVLWHEFCHVVTLQATNNKMPRWLSEGISVYEERQADPSWGEHMDMTYREMILGGKLTPVGALSSAFLAPGSAVALQFAYFESSLVVEFIMEQYGLEAVKAVLKDLGGGRTINDSLAERVAPLETLEREFEIYAKELAENLAPGMNWDRPEPELLRPGAEEKLASWAKERPSSYWVLTREAAAAMEEGKWREAKVPLLKVLDFYPTQKGGDSARALLAEVHKQLGETVEETAVLTKLTALDSAAPEASQRLMELATAAGDWATVEKQAKRFLAVNPLIATGWRYLAEAGGKTGDPAAVILACRSLLALEPPNPGELHYRLALALHKIGSDEARREVLMALEETPRHRAALKLLQEIPRIPAPAVELQPGPAPANP